jgi:pimeloyl-ACP methyl ester carboxylesterase
VRVFLIHGMGRSKASMALLARRLRARGHATSSFGYFVTRAPLSVIADRFAAHVRAARVDDEPYAIVGHSLGNVVTRIATPSLPPGLARFVMLAPPNRPPLLARTLERNPVYRALTQDAGRRLCDDDWYAGLPLPDAPKLIIAGTGGPAARWLPFKGAPSDGIVALDETPLPGVPRVEVEAIHTLIMNDRRATAAIVEFLEQAAAAH